MAGKHNDKSDLNKNRTASQSTESEDRQDSVIGQEVPITSYTELTNKRFDEYYINLISRQAQHLAELGRVQIGDLRAALGNSQTKIEPRVQSSRTCNT